MATWFDYDVSIVALECDYYDGELGPEFNPEVRRILHETSYDSLEAALEYVRSIDADMVLAWQAERDWCNAIEVEVWAEQVTDGMYDMEFEHLVSVVWVGDKKDSEWVKED